MTTSAALVTLAGVAYDPIEFDVTADNAWSPTFQANVTLARKDVTPNLAAARNLITNPAASVDLTDATAIQLTSLVRQTGIVGFGSSHQTAFRLNGSTANSNGSIFLGGDATGLRLGMQPGKTYTLSGLFFLDVPLTGTAGPLARTMAIGVSRSGGATAYNDVSAQAPNVGNVLTRLSVTFTLPADATAAAVRLFHGHASTAVCYFTDLMLVEGNGLDPDGQPTPYFDGDTLTNALYGYTWTGTAGKSPSTRGLLAAPGRGQVVDPRLYPKCRVQWWYGDGAAVPVMLDVTTTVRRVTIDDIDDTVTLTLMSDEIKLQDYKNAATTDYQPGAMTLAAMVGFALRRIGNPPANMTALPNITIPATATVWKAGDSLDNWLQGPLRTAGVELYQDASGTFYPYKVSDPGKSSEFGFASANYGENIVKAETGIDMDGDFADAVVATYSWTDASNVPRRTAYASLPASAYHKVRTNAYTTPDPGFDPTPNTRILASRAGVTADLTILPTRSQLGATQPDPGLPPIPGAITPMHLGDFLVFQLSDRTLWTATISRIRWSYPDDTVTLGLSDVAYSGNLTTG